MTIHLVSFAAAVALSLATPASVLAQEQAPKPAEGASTTSETVIVLESTPKPEKSHREMNGHLFLPSHLVEDPFSYTAFAMTFGLGSGEALGPTLQLDPPAILANTKWYGYTGMSMGIAQDVRFLEYLSARVVLGWTAYLGTGTQGAILVVGTNARLTADLGLKGSLPVGKYFRFAVTADARYGPSYNVLLAQGIFDALNACRADPANCTIDPGTFLQESDTTTWVFGLSGSWAPFPFLGLTLNGQYLNPTKSGKSSYSKNGILFAGQLDFDALPLVRWLPIGLNLAYSTLGPLGSFGVTTTTEFGFGLYYTGRKDLALGLEIDWRKARLENDLASKTTLAWINFKYYW
jgi:hypothetical protein